MIPSDPHPNEVDRLRDVHALEILDTPAEARFDRLTALARRVFEVPLAYVAIIEDNRQWIKSSCGLSFPPESTRQESMCGHSINEDEGLLISDASQDPRFFDHPFVVGPPNVRFYASRNLMGPHGHPVGTLCIVDNCPRDLAPDKLDLLRDLAKLVEIELGNLEVRAIAQELQFATEQMRERELENARLLLSILPGPVAGRLKAGETPIVDSFDEASIVFSDLVGFTPLSASLEPVALLDLLDELFSRFDDVAGKHQVERIKTIGDSYMFAAGVPEPRDDHAAVAVSVALGMLEATEAITRERGVELRARVGINSGPVVAGVVGRCKFLYDLWGDAVNVASRLESTGLPGHVHVSAATYALLNGAYPEATRRQVELKGKGLAETYLIRAPTASRASG